MCVYSPWSFHYFHPGIQKLSYSCSRRYFSLFCRQPISNYGQSAGSKLLSWPRRTTQSFRWGQRLYNAVFESSSNIFWFCVLDLYLESALYKENQPQNFCSSHKLYLKVAMFNAKSSGSNVTTHSIKRNSLKNSIPRGFLLE